MYVWNNDFLTANAATATSLFATPFSPQTCRDMDPTLGSFFLSDDCSSPPAASFELTQQPCIICPRAYQKESFFIIDTRSNNSIIDHVWLFNTKRLHQCAMVNAFMYSRGGKVNKEGCKRRIVEECGVVVV